MKKLLAAAALTGLAAAPIAAQNAPLSRDAATVQDASELGGGSGGLIAAALVAGIIALVVITVADDDDLPVSA